MRAANRQWICSWAFSSLPTDVSTSIVLCLLRAFTLTATQRGISWKTHYYLVQWVGYKTSGHYCQARYTGNGQVWLLWRWATIVWAHWQLRIQPHHVSFHRNVVSWLLKVNGKGDVVWWVMRWCGCNSFGTDSLFQGIKEQSVISILIIGSGF